MRITRNILKHVAAPVAVGAALYGADAPMHEPEENLRHKWDRARNGYAAGGGVFGGAVGHTLAKATGLKPSARALSMLLGGVGGALYGTTKLAPAHHRSEVQIRRARAAYPGGMNAATGAPVHSYPGDMDIGSAETFRTRNWGVQ